MKWLLTQIAEVSPGKTSTQNYKLGYKDGTSDQLHDTAVKLMEPCTEHGFNNGYLAVAHGHNSFGKEYCLHRKDCPACIEKLKQEAGIE